MESEIEEDIAINFFYLKRNLTNPVDFKESASNSFLDSKFGNPSIKGITAQVDFFDKDLDNVRFVQANGLPAVREHLTPKLNVNGADFICVF